MIILLKPGNGRNSKLNKLCRTISILPQFNDKGNQKNCKNLPIGVNVPSNFKGTGGVLIVAYELFFSTPNL
jgi:hypothetical protein